MIWPVLLHYSFQAFEPSQRQQRSHIRAISDCKDQLWTLRVLHGKGAEEKPDAAAEPAEKASEENALVPSSPESRFREASLQHEPDKATTLSDHRFCAGA